MLPVPINTMDGAQATSEAAHVVNVGAGEQECVEGVVDGGADEGKNQAKLYRKTQLQASYLTVL